MTVRHARATNQEEVHTGRQPGNDRCGCIRCGAHVQRCTFRDYLDGLANGQLLRQDRARKGSKCDCEHDRYAEQPE